MPVMIDPATKVKHQIPDDRVDEAKSLGFVTTVPMIDPNTSAIHNVPESKVGEGKEVGLTPDPGGLASFGRGVIHGATLGGAPVVAGAIGAVGANLRASDAEKRIIALKTNYQLTRDHFGQAAADELFKDLLPELRAASTGSILSSQEANTQATREYKQSDNAAQAAHPWAYGIGQVAGGTATAAAGGAALSAAAKATAAVPVLSTLTRAVAASPVTQATVAGAVEGANEAKKGETFGGAVRGGLFGLGFGTLAKSIFIGLRAGPLKDLAERRLAATTEAEASAADAALQEHLLKIGIPADKIARIAPTAGSTAGSTVPEVAPDIAQALRLSSILHEKGYPKEMIEKIIRQQFPNVEASADKVLTSVPRVAVDVTKDIPSEAGRYSQVLGQDVANSYLSRAANVSEDVAHGVSPKPYGGIAEDVRSLMPSIPKTVAESGRASKWLEAVLSTGANIARTPAVAARSVARIIPEVANDLQLHPEYDILGRVLTTPNAGAVAERATAAAGRGFMGVPYLIPGAVNPVTDYTKSQSDPAYRQQKGITGK